MEKILWQSTLCCLLERLHCILKRLGFQVEPLLPMQLPANSTGRMLEESPHIWVPTAPVGDPGGISGSCLSLSKACCGHLQSQSAGQSVLHSLIFSLFLIVFFLNK